MLSDEDKNWLLEQFERERTFLLERLEAERTFLLERLEAVETRLLTEFHKWASPLEARQRTHTATLRAIDAEMEALTDRVSKLEPPKPE